MKNSRTRKERDKNQKADAVVPYTHKIATASLCNSQQRYGEERCELLLNIACYSGTGLKLSTAGRGECGCYGVTRRY
ncbi:MAG: hypothetical protein FJ122_02815 [Deltaproteobacteria bacterium]|nr:hypothetical protein [Deltaproteobacteria bacterium]